MKRGDAELAAVMRKLLETGAYVDHNPRAGKLTIETMTFSITEEEFQAVEEALWAQ